jgi:Ca2+:H+ antiporter
MANSLFVCLDNAIAFAQMGNIALSLEIGSAYTIQVALLQIPALVAFSAYWRVYGHPPRRSPPSELLARSDISEAGVSPAPFRLFYKMISPIISSWASNTAVPAMSMLHQDPSQLPMPQPPAQDTFSLVFPRWDLVAVIISVFTLTYLYIEGKSNYFKGAMLLMAYGILMSAFFYAPSALSSDT